MAEKEEAVLTLDEVRDFFAVGVRACERFSASLKEKLEILDSSKPTDEWLQLTKDEASKGKLFLENQAASWEAFRQRVDAYYESVRRVADELALKELSLNPDKDDISGIESNARIIHPELQRFKQEKQAKIIGKYGGTPALGGGMILPRMPKEAILKATVSPAAREIQYSKVEGKDAKYLAKVMQFKERAQDGGDGITKTPEPTLSPWQAETVEKKGKDYFKTEEKAAFTQVHTPLSSELSSRLQARQDAVTAAEEAEVEAAKLREKSSKNQAEIATPELASKLIRRQQMDEAAEKAEAAAAEEPKPPPTSWSNTASPFGSELSEALQRRTQAAAEAAVEAAKSVQDVSANTPAPKPAGGGFTFATPSMKSSEVVTPATLKKAGMTPMPGMTPMLPTGSQSELAEKLRKRAEALDQ